MALEIKEYNILVNAVISGFIATHRGMAKLGARSVAESVPGINWAGTSSNQSTTGKVFIDRQEISW